MVEISLPECDSIAKTVSCARSALTVQVNGDVGSMYRMESQHYFCVSVHSEGRAFTQVKVKKGKLQAGEFELWLSSRFGDLTHLSCVVSTLVANTFDETSAF